jgi:hypothetical protein
MLEKNKNGIKIVEGSNFIKNKGGINKKSNAKILEKDSLLNLNI